MTCDINQLTEDLITELDEMAQEILEAVHPEDLLTERADAWVPIYYGDLADCLAADTSLAQVDDPGLLPADTYVWQIISIAIFERLQAAAYEWLEEAQEQQAEAA